MVIRTWLVSTAMGIAVMVAAGSNASSPEIHVAKTGDDSGRGSEAAPYLTIGKAATVAQPGDIVTVHTGTYREWVKPARGGTGEDGRIVYRAAPGEDVLIKGSERITSWTAKRRAASGRPNSRLRSSATTTLSPSNSLAVGSTTANGTSRRRLPRRRGISREANSRRGRPDREPGIARSTATTTICANFGRADPNIELTEINVRECLFMPTIARLNTSPSTVSTSCTPPRIGHRPYSNSRPGPSARAWENTGSSRTAPITNARCVGIILGHAPGVDYDDIDAYGDHIVRNNVIRRCGQAGIAGQKGATRSLICGNLIEDTNYRREFGGWETAAIKFHNSVDTVIRGNLIRGVFHQSRGRSGSGSTSATRASGSPQHYLQHPGRHRCSSR